MSKRWYVTLYNQHAMQGIGAAGRTRRDAFNRAFKRAGSTHRHYKLADRYGSTQGTDVMWLAAFHETVDYMRPGTTSASTTFPVGLCVEVRRARPGDM